MLTGTAILNRPQELVEQLRLLGHLQTFGGEMRFLKDYTVFRYGNQFVRPQNLDILNERLRRLCYIRRIKSEVLTELPDKQRITLNVDIYNRQAYNLALKDTQKFLQEQGLMDENFIDSIRNLPLLVQNMKIAERNMESEVRSRRMNILAKIELLKQLCAQGKIPTVVEWINDFLEGEDKLIVFAHHRFVQEALFQKFPKSAHIFSKDSLEERQVQEKRFQTDPECRVIICSLQAGGLGINLTAASNVIFLELGWNPAVHNQAEDRAHRIGQKESVSAYYFLAKDTIDDWIWELIEQKRTVVDGTLDGADEGIQSDIFNELVARLKSFRL